MIQKQNWFRQWFFLLTWWVVWAWFFAMPQTVNSAGIVSSIMIIAWVGIVVTIMHLILAEVSLSLPGHKTFVGMAKSLFPPRLAQATQHMNTLNNLIWIIAYIILGWSFLHTLFSYVGVHIDIVWRTFIYFCIMGYCGLISIKTLNKWDNIIVVILLLTVGIIILSALLFGSIDTIEVGTFSQNFSVYGISLFALSCINAIPLLYHSTGNSAIKMRNVILASWGTTTLIAILFSISIIALSKYWVTESAISWLSLSWYNVLAILWSLAWIAAIFSSHVPVLENTQEIFIRDLWYSKLKTRIITTMIPFLIILYLDVGLVELLWTAWSLLWWILFFFVCLLNIYLHRTQQKVRIIPMISYDQTWSLILALVCAIGILYQVLTFY